TSAISTLSLHDALPISADAGGCGLIRNRTVADGEKCILHLVAAAANSQRKVFGEKCAAFTGQNRLMQRAHERLRFRPCFAKRARSEEHTSELQSRSDLV